MECRRNQGALILSALKNTVLIREIRVKYFGYVRVKCGISKVSVFSIGYQYSKILLKVIHINCSKDLIIFFHT